MVLIRVPDNPPGATLFQKTQKHAQGATGSFASVYLNDRAATFFISRVGFGFVLASKTRKLEIVTKQRTYERHCHQFWKPGTIQCNTDFDNHDSFIVRAGFGSGPINNQHRAVHYRAGKRPGGRSFSKK